MTIHIAAISTELVPVTVQVNQGGMAIDPTDQDVFLAFVPTGEVPDAGDWIAGEWEGDEGIEHTAHALASSLDAGRYDIWVRVDWPPESRRGKAGRLVVA